MPMRGGSHDGELPGDTNGEVFQAVPGHGAVAQEHRAYGRDVSPGCRARRGRANPDGNIGACPTRSDFGSGATRPLSCALKRCDEFAIRTL